MDSDATKVRYPPIHLYPKTAEPLPTILVGLLPEHANRQLAATWRATATNTPGDVAGTITLETPAAPDVELDLP